MRLWAMLKRWLMIREQRGCPVSPTYWRPHLLHCIRSITLDILQGPRSFSLKHSQVTLLENVSVVTNMGQVLLPSSFAVTVARGITDFGNNVGTYQ